MAKAKGSLRGKLLEILFTAIIQGVLVGGLVGFWFNRQLETYKKELADDTEQLKTALQYNAPLLQQRRSAYLDIQQGARQLKRVLESYYFRAKEPPTGAVMSNKLRTLENDMGLGSGSTGGSWVTKQDVVSALGVSIFLREQYADIASDTVNAAEDSFLETMLEDVRKAGQKDGDTESFHTAARTRLKEGFSQLDRTITQALRIGELPFK